MKNSLYTSTALMIAVWVPIHFFFHLHNAYILLIMAAIIGLFRLIFSSRLNKY